jgi:DinB superfamily
MSGVDDARAELAAARDELLAAIDGITREELLRPPPGEPSPQDERWPIRDVLWHVGMWDDYVRRSIDATRRHVPPPPFENRIRPLQLETPEMLRAWIDQARHLTLVLLGKLSEAELAETRRGPNGRDSSFRSALAFLASHDRQHAQQVRALRAEGAAAVQ